MDFRRWKIHRMNIPKAGEGFSCEKYILSPKTLVSSAPTWEGKGGAEDTMDDFEDKFRSPFGLQSRKVIKQKEDIMLHFTLATICCSPGKKNANR